MKLSNILNEAKYHREDHVVSWIKEQLQEIMQQGRGWDEIHVDDAEWSNAMRKLTATFGQPKYQDQGHGIETYTWEVEDVTITMVFLVPHVQDPRADYERLINVAHVDYPHTY